MNDISFLDTECISQIDNANFVDVDAAYEADQEQDTFVDGCFAIMRTNQMEFDVECPIGKLPGCFCRELGDAIEPYVMLQEPNYNEFEVNVMRNSSRLYFGDGWYALKSFYRICHGAWVSLAFMNPRLLLIRLTTRWGTKVDFPAHNPPLRHLAILRWDAFGEFVFDLNQSKLVLIDCSGDRYPCELQITVDADGQFACKISRGWVDLCVVHAFAPGDKVRFSVTEPKRNHEVYVSFFPPIKERSG
ncbi:hypothetical protein TSUD_135410 [Trifolium subterraneum]|uniref:TF-B3 domain-containing protein n=1 Tax=Trifolium subterraneum TaxID=3900 RepID=A0A2Z6PKC8_TRISU|nr:hypothetical protein TSUD_135410 [Trifolium subterraneum]